MDPTVAARGVAGKMAFRLSLPATRGCRTVVSLDVAILGGNNGPSVLRAVVPVAGFSPAMDGSHRVARETAPPSVFEKGDPMNRRLVAAVLLATALSCLPVLALDIVVGGAVPSPADRSSPVEAQSLKALAASLVLPDGSTARGLALGEVAPLLEEAWRLDARGADGTKAWSDDTLAERLYAIYLVESSPATPATPATPAAKAAAAKTASGWDLVVGKERFRGVESIRLAGSLLAEDGLEVWLSWEGVPEIKTEIARFAAAHGKRIKAIEVPNTQSKMQTVARGGGALPDLAMIQSDYVPALAGGKLIQSVDWFRMDELEPKGYEAFRSEGHSWAVPFYYDAQLVFYNKALVKSAPPVDWCLDDMAALARPLKGRVKAPLAWNVYSAYWLLPFMLGFGKDSVVDPDGGMTVNDRPTADALHALLGLMDEGLLEPAERDAMVAWFASGQAGFILAGSYSIPQFSKLGIDFGVAPYPLARRGGKPIAPMLDFKGFAVSRRTERPVLARRLVQALVSQGFQTRFTSALGKLPASLAALENSRGRNPWYPQLKRSAEVGAIVPPADSYTVFKNIMWKLLRFILTGQQTVEETLATAQRLIDEGGGPQ
jgi:arabinogalactan oligomer/maltooligosaccharide transport system substrate-binding protein